MEPLLILNIYGVKFKFEHSLNKRLRLCTKPHNSAQCG